MVSQYLFKADGRRPARPRVKEWRQRCRGLAGRTQAGVQQTETHSAFNAGFSITPATGIQLAASVVNFIRLPAPLLPSASPPRAS